VLLAVDACFGHWCCSAAIRWTLCFFVAGRGCMFRAFVLLSSYSLDLVFFCCWPSMHVSGIRAAQQLFARPCVFLLLVVDAYFGHSCCSAAIRWTLVFFVDDA
jgi:hypothetical protein